MNEIADLLAYCRDAGITLAPAKGNRLTIEAPNRVVTPELLSQLREFKGQILAELRRVMYD